MVELAQRDLASRLARARALSWALFCCAGAAAVAAAYVVREAPIYHWDTVGYWSAYSRFGDGMTHLGSWLHEQARGIWRSEYNSSPVILLQPFFLAFKDSRAGFIAAIACIYLVPTAFLAARLIRTLAKRSGIDAHPDSLWLLELVALLYTPFWVPTVRGYPDIVGCLSLVCLTLLIWSTDLTRAMRWTHVIVAGILLWLPFLFRKWYAYTLIAFVRSACALAIGQRLAKSDRRAGARVLGAIVPLANIAAIVGVAAVFAALFQGGLLKHAWRTDYKDIFRAYQVDLRSHVFAFYYHYGPFLLAFAALGLVLGTFHARTRLVTAFVATNLVLTLVLFGRTQSFGPQHSLPISLWLLCLAGLGLLATVGSIARPATRWGAAIAVGAIFLLVFANTVFKPVRLASALGPAETAYPLTSSDLDRYAALEQSIRTSLGPGEHVAIFASSGQLNDSLLETVSNHRLTPHLQGVSHVDRRDMFRLDALRAEYAVATAPVQTHLPPEEQQVITRTAEQILQSTGIGAAYVALPETFQMSGFVTRLYRRSRAVTFDELARFLDGFFSRYPEWRKHYALGELLYVSGEYTLGDIWGSVVHPNPNELVIHTGEHSSTEARFSFRPWNGQAIERIEMLVSPEEKIHCPDADGVQVSVLVNEQMAYSGIVEPNGASVAVPISAGPDGAGTLKLVVDKNRTTFCDRLHLRFVTDGAAGLAAAR